MRPSVVEPRTAVAGVADIAAAVGRGAMRAGDVLADCEARHRETHPAINALVQPRFAAAAAEALAIDAAPRGLLAGVPVSVKECFPVAGLQTTLGIETLRGPIDAADAPLVTRLRQAGAVVVGKANVPQAMYLHETDNPVWGRTNHPQAADRGPGGSSGGDAALVAAGVVPLAVGNDLAGSLRQPAHACGIAAIMPRTSALGGGGAFETMPHLTAVRVRAGFLARTAADLRHALAAIDALAGADAAAAPPQGLRIGWWDDTGPVAASPAIRRGVAEAVSRLQAAGVETTRLEGAVAIEAAWLLLAILSADGAADVRRLFGGRRPIPGVARLLSIARLPRGLRPLVAGAARLAGSRLEAEALTKTGPRRGAAFAALLASRTAFHARFTAAVAGCDAIVCPVSALPALRHGTAARLVLAAAPCLVANLLDLAAGAVPVTVVRPDEEAERGSSRDPVLRAAADADRGSRGLPVGVQVIGAPGRGEATVLDVMEAIERGPQPAA